MKILHVVLVCWLGTTCTLASEIHDPPTFFSHLIEHERAFWFPIIEKDTWQDRRTKLLIGLSALSGVLDEGVTGSLRKDTSLDSFDDFFDSTAFRVGLNTFPLIFLAAGELSDNQKIAEFGWKGTEAVVHAAAVGFVLKAATQRARPHTGREYGFFQGGNSFPSGHSMTAWALAGVALRTFPDQKWLPWIAFPAAALVSFSRVSTGNHFFSDVVAGSALGFTLGFWVVK